MRKAIKDALSDWLDRRKPRPAPPETDRAWIELDLKNLEHNVRQLRCAMPAGCQLMAVVKAEAYGHGAFQIATHLQEIGVKAFAVATIDEGIHLRHYGITGEILVLGYTAPARAQELRRYDLIQTLVDFDHAAAMNHQGIPIRAHMKIDTGMHRLGFDVEDFGQICNTFLLPYLRVEGIYTHLCVSDSLAEADAQFTMAQAARFQELLQALSAVGIPTPKIHIQSSYGLLNYPELKSDYARVGIALYGAYSSPHDETRQKPDLRPVLALRSSVVSLRSIPAGETAGYGRAFAAQRDTRLAIVPMGYADGVPRELSCGRGSVLVGGCRAPIVGRICMDQLAVDVTDVPGVKPGMTVTLIGKDGALEQTAADVAEAAGTIANEILSRLGQRLHVVCK